MSGTTPPPASSNGPPPPSSQNASPPPAPPTSTNSPPPQSSPPPPSSSNSPPPAPSKSPPPSPPNSPPPAPPPSSPPPSPPSSPPPSPPNSPPPSPPPATNTPPPNNPNPPPPPSGPSPPPPPKSHHSPPPPVANSPPPPPTQSSTPTGTPPPSHDSIPPPPPPIHTAPTPGSAPSPPTQALTPPPPSTPSTSPHSNDTSPNTPPSPPLVPRVLNPTPPPNSPTDNNTGSIIGGGVAGVVIIAFLALFFVARRRKKRSTVFSSHYMPPNNFPSKSDGYYVHNSGPQSGGFYPQPQQSFQTNGHSYVSQTGSTGSSYNNQGPPESSGIGGAKSWFSYEEVMEITNGFSRQNIIGEGGFGCVFKGWLPDGRVVAVKQLKKGSGQGEREFRAEVEIISRVHHRYLVSLVGYCVSDSQRLLIYEYVPNQTLEHHLHGKGMPVLEWVKRMKIALGSARGLAYLHEDCHPKIIHRDIKSANILLDDAFEAQVADFGLAKLTDDTETHVSTRVMGTFGYMAPEYASSGKLTDRSDVFSFGVVLLELITGRKPVDQTRPYGDESLVEWARPRLGHAIDTGDFSELVDLRLEKNYVESEMLMMIEVAAASVRHSAPKRPRMLQVARALECEGEASDLSNGVKYGQSTIYESSQYNQDISRFRKMAFGSGDSKEFAEYSGDYSTTSESPSGESETRAMNVRRL